MKLRCLWLSLFAVLLTAATVFGEVVGGDDFDPGGLDPVTRVLSPDNTANNGRFTTSTGGVGSFFDSFGIATIDIDGLGDSIDLPFDVVDQSLVGFPGDRSGVIPETKRDFQFVIVDLENNDNPTSPRASAEWTFDIAGATDLSVSLDFGAIGDFGASGPGRDNSFIFSYSIDGSTSQPFMSVTSPDDDRPYVVTMLDGNQYSTGDANFFFNEANYGLLGCQLGVANSCTTFDNGLDLFFADPLDTNQDGSIYVDPVNVVITDTPLNPGDLTEGQLRIYGETNSNGTFSNPEFELFKNPLWINGDESRIIQNQIATFTEAIAGSGDVLTITLDATQYGGDRYFVFDNLVVEGTIGGGISGDFNGDGTYDCLDVDPLVAAMVAGTNDPAFDLTGDDLVNGDDLAAWLVEGGNAEVGGAFLAGDANLDGVVDVSDFNNWNSSKFTSGSGYCAGDFNGDGSTDVSDFNLWNGNKFQTSAGTLVPEPASWTLFGLAAASLLRLRRRQA